jgi:hypothetical protein
MALSSSAKGYCSMRDTTSKSIVVRLSFEYGV